MAAPSLNTTIAALGAVIQAALASVPVDAPAIAIDPASTTFPRIQVAPWHYRVEEIGSAERGNPSTAEGGHGPNQYVLILLWSPIVPTLNQAAALTDMFSAVDTIINAWGEDKGKVFQLPDGSGVPQVEDSAPCFDANFGQQGCFISYRNIAYLGCYMTVDVTELTRP